MVDLGCSFKSPKYELVIFYGETVSPRAIFVRFSIICQFLSGFPVQAFPINAYSFLDSLSRRFHKMAIPSWIPCPGVSIKFQFLPGFPVQAFSDKCLFLPGCLYCFHWVLCIRAFSEPSCPFGGIHFQKFARAHRSHGDSKSNLQISMAIWRCCPPWLRF